jgi:hypothetical protein
LQEEGVAQSELFLDLILSNHQIKVIANYNLESYKNVFRVYGKILMNTKFHSDTIKFKIRAHLTSLRQDPYFQANKDQLWTHLGVQEKDKILELMI